MALALDYTLHSNGLQDETSKLGDRYDPPLEGALG